MKQLEIWGAPARVKIELDIGPGRTATVDVTDAVTHNGDGFNQAALLRLPLFGIVQDRVLGVLDEVAFRGLDR